MSIPMTDGSNMKQPNGPESFVNMDAGQLSALGNRLMKQRRFDDAAAAFRRLHEINPQEVKVLNSLGTALFMSGWQDEAINCMQKAVRAQPDNATFHANLAKMFAVANRWQEALASIESAMRAYVGSPKQEWQDIAAYCREALINA